MSYQMAKRKPYQVVIWKIPPILSAESRFEWPNIRVVSKFLGQNTHKMRRQINIWGMERCAICLVSLIRSISSISVSSISSIGIAGIAGIAIATRLPGQQTAPSNPIIQWLVQRGLPFPSFPQSLPASRCWIFWPHRSFTDGFFIKKQPLKPTVSACATSTPKEVHCDYNPSKTTRKIHCKLQMCVVSQGYFEGKLWGNLPSSTLAFFSTPS